MEHPWNNTFCGVLGRDSPKYGPILLKFAPELVFKESKTRFENYFKNLKFYGKKFALFSLFVQLWPHFSSWRRPKWKKLDIFADKTTPLVYPNMAKSRSYLDPIFQEKYDYFLSLFGCFLLKRGCGRKRVGIKISPILDWSHDSWGLKNTKGWVPLYPGLEPFDHKGCSFKKILNFKK